MFIVLLQCPVFNWHDKNVRDLFCQLSEFKLQGYRKYHFQSVLPLDTADFVADHLLICQKKTSGIQILSGVKSLSLETANHFKIAFTPKMIVMTDNVDQHDKAYEDIVNNAYKTGRKLGYYSSWTLADSLKSKEEREEIKELFTSITANYHRDYNIHELFGMGVPKFKTDKFFETWGYERVTYEGRPLCNLPASLLDGIDSVLMHLKEFSPHAINLAEKHYQLWNDRKIIGSSPVFSDHKDLKAA